MKSAKCEFREISVHCSFKQRSAPFIHTRLYLSYGNMGCWCWDTSSNNNISSRKSWAALRHLWDHTQLTTRLQPPCTEHILGLKHNYHNYAIKGPSVGNDLKIQLTGVKQGFFLILQKDELKWVVAVFIFTNTLGHALFFNG